MLARVLSGTPWGVETLPVQVEVDARVGLPQLQLVGLPDAAVRESRERVRSAIRHCGYDLPPRAVVINLAPADNSATVTLPRRFYAAAPLHLPCKPATAISV